MKRVSLKFEDILQLIDFMEVTENQDSLVDMEKQILTCELSEAQVELAINGYGATLLAE